MTWVTRAALVLALALTTTLLVGCDDQDPADPRPEPLAARSPFAPQRATPPDGFHVEQCPDLRAHHNSGLAARLIVPDEFTAEVSWNGAGCSFTADLDRQLYLEFGPLKSLAAYTERNVAPFEGDGRATCAGQGRTASFVPPLPQTDGIDLITGSRCFVYLRPRDALLRHAEVDVVPNRSLAGFAARLESRPAIGEVTLEPGAAMLDGEPADRLTWVLERTHNGFKGKAGTYRAVAVGTADLQVIWCAEVDEWASDRAAYQRFVASVRSERR